MARGERPRQTCTPRRAASGLDNRCVHTDLPRSAEPLSRPTTDRPARHGARRGRRHGSVHAHPPGARDGLLNRTDEIARLPRAAGAEMSQARLAPSAAEIHASALRTERGRYARKKSCSMASTPCRSGRRVHRSRARWSHFGSPRTPSRSTGAPRASTSAPSARRAPSRAATSALRADSVCPRRVSASQVAGMPPRGPASSRSTVNPRNRSPPALAAGVRCGLRRALRVGLSDEASKLVRT